MSKSVPNKLIQTLDGYEPPKQVVEAISGYRDHLPTNLSHGNGLVFIGAHNSGTDLAAAILYHALVFDRVDVVWASAFNYFNSLLDLRDMRKHDAFFRSKSELQSADVLIVDKIESLRDKNRILDLFYQAIFYRNEEGLATILTYNIATTDVPHDWESALNTDLGDDVAGVIRRMSQQVVIL